MSLPTSKGGEYIPGDQDHRTRLVETLYAENTIATAHRTPSVPNEQWILCPRVNTVMRKHHPVTRF